MAMKRLIYTVMALCAALLCSCSDDEDMLTKQKDSIVKYLTSSRRLIDEQEVSTSLQENPPFYTAFNNSSYRHITNYYEAGREEWMEVEPNSIIDIQFNAYIFSGSEPNLASTYWSNIPATISAIEASNKHQYDKLIWSTDPLTVRLGRGEVIEGLEVALIGCRDQDSVQVYMTSQAAYGKHIIGSVPKNSSVAWYIKILSVTR
ncbi:MAG: FKBP-type peptidyl-prolyl cis-trans isomerase [Rikenellaceae bacterium]|nr:FKBP-type peptidyl-prolyl cis-trans isomerase [Rikenellaceae bacterium]